MQEPVFYVCDVSRKAIDSRSPRIMSRPPLPTLLVNKLCNLGLSKWHAINPAQKRVEVSHIQSRSRKSGRYANRDGCLIADIPGRQRELVENQPLPSSVANSLPGKPEGLQKVIVVFGQRELTPHPAAPSWTCLGIVEKRSTRWDEKSTFSSRAMVFTPCPLIFIFKIKASGGIFPATVNIPAPVISC